MKKTLISIILCCTLLLGCAGVKADVGCCIINYNKNYTLTSNGYTDVIRVAQAQVGRSKESYGYNGNWCAAFVTDCAMLAGQSNPIPFKTGLTHDCTKLRNAVIAAGGSYIYNGSIIPTISNAKEGDLVFFSYNGSTYDHVGFMVDGSNTIEGNCPKGSTSYVERRTLSGRAFTYISIVRPAYDVSYPCSPDTNTRNFAAIHARNITNTTAQICASVADYRKDLANHGYRLRKASDKTLIADHAYNQYAFSDSFFFNLSNLSPGTTYEYQLWYTGYTSEDPTHRTYTTNWHSFTTKGSVAVTGVTLTPASASLNIKDSITLTATVSPANATNKTVTWASSNPAVATVTNGIVAAVAPGTATITATAANGVAGRAAITVNAPTHSPLNISCRINGKAAGQLIPGVFDLYINRELVAAGISSYSGEVPIDASYTVHNIVANAGYTAKNTSIIGTIVYNHPAIYLDFDEADAWTYAPALPAGITPDLYNIEYRLYEEKTATTSPGADWVRAELVGTHYIANGAPYQSDLPLATSETRKQTDWFYFHWCGNGQSAEHYQTDKYYHYDSIPDKTKVIVTETATDQLDSRYVYYNLNWLDNSKAYCQSGITCDGAYGSHGQRSFYWYKMYVYQDYTAVSTYRYTRDTGWTSSAPAKYSQVRYAPKSSQPVMKLVLPSALKQIGDEAFLGCGATEIVIPTGCKSIGSRAFANCTSLKQIHIPASVTSIADDAFEGCGILTLSTSRGSTANQFAETRNGFVIVFK